MVKSYQIFLGLLFLFVVGTAVVSIINIKPKNPILTQQSEIIPIPVSELKEAITKSFEAGNPSFLKPYLTEVVALDILETEEDLEVADAILQLEDFFLIHPPQKFQIKHDGVSKSGKGSYLIDSHSFIFFVQLLE